MSHCHAQTLSGGACKNNPQGGSDFCAIHNTKRDPSRVASKPKQRRSSKPKQRQSSKPKQSRSSTKSSFFDIPTRFSGAVQAATRYGKAAIDSMPVVKYGRVAAEYGKAALPYGQAAIAAAGRYGKAAVSAGSRMAQDIPVVKYGKAALHYGQEAVSSFKSLMSPRQKMRFEWMTNLSDCPALNDENMEKLEKHGIDSMNALVAKYFKLDRSAKDFTKFLRNAGMMLKDAELCVAAMQNSFG
jgi:hypothetical protein